MPFISNTYRVLIASPTDVKTERDKIPEVLHRWNVENSNASKAVFIPIKWETNVYPSLTINGRPQESINEQIVRSCDILIGAFWTRLGTPTGQADSGTLEEINEFLKAKKPVMLYFSKVPVDLDSVDFEQYDKLKALKKACQSLGITQEYYSIEELEGKVKSQITFWLRDQALPVAQVDTLESPSVAVPSQGSQKAEAKRLLGKLKAFSRKMRTNWITERDSETHKVDGAKHMLVQLNAALSDFYAELREFFSEEELQDLVSAMTNIKKQRQALDFLTMGFDMAALWQFGIQMNQALEEYAGQLEKKLDQV